MIHTVFVAACRLFSFTSFFGKAYFGCAKPVCAAF